MLEMFQEEQGWCKVVTMNYFNAKLHLYKYLSELVYITMKVNSREMRIVADKEIVRRYKDSKKERRIALRQQLVYWSDT